MAAVDYEWLRDFCCTDRHRELLDAIRDTETVREAADAIGMAERNAYAMIQRLKKTAADKGVAPGVLGKPLPEGQSLKGVSTLHNADGEPILQWVKSNADQQARQEAMREFVEELGDYVKPKKPTRPPQNLSAGLLAAYPIGDHHFGMYAWKRETGGAYDTTIAKELLADAVDCLVDSAPDCEDALLVNLGDYLHGDDSSNTTKRSGHQLDMDTRYPKTARMAAFGLAHTIERMLQKHSRVKVVNVRGNHDEDSAGWLTTVLLAYFRDEPRVTVEDSPREILFHQFGKNMIGMTHGHTIKLNQMPQIMAAAAPEMWGQTKYRVGWQGHVHHSQRLAVKEDGGAICETFGVLPPNDKYSASLGYTAQREMHCITFKESGGILCRTTYNAELP